MKATRTINDFAAEIERQNKSKRDFVVSVPKIQVYPSGNDVELAFPLKDVTVTDDDFFAGKLTQTGHDQLGEWANIPKAYYQRMQGGNVELLAKNLQWWLNRSSDRRMIRTLDGNVRGVLSDKYRRMDNHDLLTAMLPILLEHKADIVSCEITDRKLYVKALLHRVKAKVVGDVLEAGVVISNSEIGYGALSVRPLAFKLGCLNGMIYDLFKYRKFHVGKRIEESGELVNYAEDTKAADDKAFWLKTRDTVTQCLSQATLDNIAKMMNEAHGIKIADPQIAIELAADKFQFNETEKGDILKHLVEGGSLTNFGLANAVTRMAQDVESYDRSIELEQVGFKLLTGNWTSAN